MDLAFQVNKIGNENIAKYLKLYTEANDNLEQIKYTVESYISKDTKATVDKLLKKY